MTIQDFLVALDGNRHLYTILCDLEYVSFTDSKKNMTMIFKSMYDNNYYGSTDVIFKSIYKNFGSTDVIFKSMFDNFGSTDVLHSR